MRRLTAAELEGLRIIVESKIPHNLTARLVRPLDGLIHIENSAGRAVYKHCDLKQLGNYLWMEMNTRILIPVNPSGRYFIRIDTNYTNRKEFGALLVRKRLGNTCVLETCKNITGGYWYEPEHTMPAYVLKFLQSTKFKTIMAFVYAFNEQNLTYGFVQEKYRVNF